MKINKWFKDLLYVVKHYRSDIDIIQRKADYWEGRCIRAENLIKERTSINVDVHPRGRAEIITIGRYRNRDYVQTYTINSEDFGHLIDQLRNMQQYGVIEKIDCLPNMKAVFKRELLR